MRPARQPLAELVRIARRAALSGPDGLPDPLDDIPFFGANPGALRMRVFIPPGLPAGAPLLVALHGCTQSAAGFDHGCGWSDLAAAHGFALLMPEQRGTNNAAHCFNWFEPGDTSRGLGEVASIQAMVAHLLATHRLEPARVFVAGLSAGGAMAAALLATYPEMFAAGAIIAGLPYGAATSVQDALEAMAGHRTREPEDWAALVRAAAPERASTGAAAWPRLSIWQGEADETVNPVNAVELAKQWAALHGLDPDRPGKEEPLGRPGAGRRWRWLDGQGRVSLEVNTLPGLTHGVPINPGLGEGHGGRTMPFILDAGVPAPLRVAEFFGLVPPPRPPARTEVPVIPVGATETTWANGNAEPAEETRPVIPVGTEVAAEPPPVAPSLWSDPGAAIRRALRAAGLLRGD